jgi:hypothetical protein
MLMQLDSARELKATLLSKVIMPLGRETTTKAVLGLPTGPVKSGPVPTLALGITRRSGREYALAVRIQQRPLERSKTLDLIRRQAKNEVDVRYVGRVEKAAAPTWFQQRQRPLAIGTSVGHHEVTAGTLGCFVHRLGDELEGAMHALAGNTLLMLSNNHVLANENRGKVGDAILQPGAIDGGKQADDVAAALLDFVRLKKVGPNLVDAAVARLADGVKANVANLRGLGKLAGVGDGLFRAGMEVGKLGRTTGKTHGRVTAFEVDNLFVRFDGGELEFNGQVEIEGDGEPFALGGDSGSLIVDGSRRAVALLFAVAQLGGSAGQGVTYANPFDVVLRELKIGLATP